MSEWCVAVSINGEPALTISSSHIAGRDLTEEDEKAVKEAAEGLMSFVGPGGPVWSGSDPGHPDGDETVLPF